MANSSAFGTLLRYHRKSRRLTQESLAERAGFSRLYVALLEGGKRTPPSETARLFAEALGLGAEERAELEVAATSTRSLAKPSSLPAPPTPIIGRENDIELLCKLLNSPEARLLTLVGPGGVGKTRLALEVAKRVGSRFLMGAHFVDLASVHDPDLLMTAMARTLDVTATDEAALIERLKVRLQGGMLLVLDNFEQLLSGALKIARLMSDCPDLHLLVTSRAALGLRGEHEFVVQPLKLPSLNQLPVPSSLKEYPAVKLLTQRAQDVRPKFDVTEANASAVARLCVRLDGLPLAIELAASQLKVVSAATLLRRLEDRLSVPQHSMRDLPTRQQSLRATLEWSYSLLAEPEQRLFPRLAVFAGGWTLEAAEQVCAGGVDDVLGSMTKLVDQSLLQCREQVDGEMRFSMLETVRAYALEQLEQCGETDLLLQRHAEYFLELAEIARVELHGKRQVEWLELLESEHDNLLAALGWYRDSPGAADLGLRLAGALMSFWYIRGYSSEGRQWIELFLARSKEAGLKESRAEALLAAGMLSWRQGDIPSSRTFEARSRKLWQDLQDQGGIGRCEMLRGMSAIYLGEGAEAGPALEKALAFFREVGDKRNEGLALYLLGWANQLMGRWDMGRALLEATLPIVRDNGDIRTTGLVLWYLGQQEYQQGRLCAAQGYLDEAKTLFRKLGDKYCLSSTLNTLGQLARAEHAYDRAAAYFDEVLQLRHESGDAAGVADVLQRLEDLTLT